MTEFKGTKGKWVYDYEQESILSENGYIIADIFPVGKEANALLISKAPEMLEMLNEIVRRVEIIKSEPNGIVRDSMIYNIDMDIEQLIKEATEI